MTPLIQFKTKVFSLRDGDTVVPAINYKVKVGRTDCNLRPCDHTYYNSDLFPAILNRAYQQKIGGRSWIRLSDLPQGVSVDTSKFLAVVTIDLTGCERF